MLVEYGLFAVMVFIIVVIAISSFLILYEEEEIKPINSYSRNCSDLPYSPKCRTPLI